jgi:uncharacterized protein (DUF2147 family)
MLLALFWLNFAWADFKVEGKWLTSDKSGVIEIYEEDKLFHGRVVGGEPQGDGLDRKNPDPSKRERTLLGVTILKNLKREGDEFSGGEIYDPNTGNTYKCKAELVDNNTFKLRGYIGISLFGRTEVWSREK